MKRFIFYLLFFLSYSKCSFLAQLDYLNLLISNPNNLRILHGHNLMQPLDYNNLFKCFQGRVCYGLTKESISKCETNFYFLDKIPEEENNKFNNLIKNLARSLILEYLENTTQQINIKPKGLIQSGYQLLELNQQWTGPSKIRILEQKMKNEKEENKKQNPSLLKKI
jgi:hypothetical protein